MALVIVQNQQETFPGEKSRLAALPVVPQRHLCSAGGGRLAQTALGCVSAAGPSAFRCACTARDRCGTLRPQVRTHSVRREVIPETRGAHEALGGCLSYWSLAVGIILPFLNQNSILSSHKTTAGNSGLLQTPTRVIATVSRNCVLSQRT